MSTKTLSPSMKAVISRLQAGDGRIVPLRGGYWLPGDVATTVPQDGTTWSDRSESEFGAKVGTRTVQALAERGVLVPMEVGFDPRSPDYALRVHRLATGTAEH